MNYSRFDPNGRDYMNFSCYIPERYSFLRKTLSFFDLALHPLFRKKIDTAKIKRILILRQDRIGDLVVTTPLFRALKEKFPGIVLDVMINPEIKDVVRGNPFVDNIIEAKPNWFSYKKNAAIISRVFDFFSSLNEVFKLAKKIKENKYDLVIDCTAKRRNALLSFLAGSPYRIGFDIMGGSFLYSARVKRIFSLSYINQLAELLTPLGIKLKDPKPEIFAPNMHEKEDGARQTALSPLVGQTFRFALKIGIHLSHGGRSGKRWPIESWIELTDKLIKSGKKVILFYGLAEKNDAEAIKRAFRENKNFTDTGLLKLNEFIEKVTELSLFIGVESGPVHIASALKIPVVALFGGSDPALWPFFGGGKIIRKVSGGYCGRRECEDGLCIKAITPEEVYRAAESALK